jgi:hypothetical protein
VPRGVVETGHVLNVARIVVIATVLASLVACQADDARDRAPTAPAAAPATTPATSRPPEAAPSPAVSAPAPEQSASSPAEPAPSSAEPAPSPAEPTPSSAGGQIKAATTRAQVTPRATETIRTAGTTPLCLDLTSSRTRSLLGEPLTLAATLTNCSKEPMRVRDLLAPEFGVLGVFMRRPGEEAELLYQPAVRREGRGTRAIDLAPGEAVSATVPVYFGRDGWTLTKPGDYAFRAEYSITGLELQSKTLRVRVEEPKDSSAMSAAREFMSPEAARYFYLGGGDAKGEEILRSIAQRHPGTPWSGYARLALAIDGAGQKGQPGVRGCDELESTLPAVRDWLVAARGYRALATCLRDTGQAERADAVLEELARKSPEARTLR